MTAAQSRFGVSKAYGVQGLCAFHGYKDKLRHVPLVKSICVSLTALESETSVLVSPKVTQPTISVAGMKLSSLEVTRLRLLVNETFLRQANLEDRFIINSQNAFPPGWGLGTSGSGFAALSLACSSATGLTAFEKSHFDNIRRLSPFSCPFALLGGVTIYKPETDSYSVLRNSILDNVDIFVVPIRGQKSSRDKHAVTSTSPFKGVVLTRGALIANRIEECLRSGDFGKLGRLVEEALFLKFSTIVTSSGHIIPCSPETLRVLQTLRALRREDYEKFFITMNSGASVFIYSNGFSGEISALLENEGIKYVISKVSPANVGIDSITLNTET